MLILSGMSIVFSSTAENEIKQNSNYIGEEMRVYVCTKEALSIMVVLARIAEEE